MLTILYLIVAILVSMIATLPPLGLAVTILFFAMAGLGMGNGSVFQLVPHRFKEQVGAATGVLGAAGGLGGFFLPTLLGSLKQSTGTYATGLLVFASASALAFCCLRLGQRRWVGAWIAEHGLVPATRPERTRTVFPETEPEPV
jgi:NNP family nitrate/nitrite transporter-like MFS transporter